VISAKSAITLSSSRSECTARWYSDGVRHSANGMFIRHSALWMSRLSQRRPDASSGGTSNMDTSSARGRAKGRPRTPSEMSTWYTLTSCSITARFPRSRNEVGRRVTGETSGTPALAMMKFSRLVSTTKWRISSSPASAETKVRRNQTHSRSMVPCAETRDEPGISRFTTKISNTANRENNRSNGYR